MDDDIPPGLLRPYNATEAITTKEAAAEARRCEATIRTWCERHGLGRRVPASGPLRVSKVALRMHLDGDADALRAYLAGHRGEPVARYFREADIPISREAGAEIAPADGRQLQ